MSDNTAALIDEQRGPTGVATTPCGVERESEPGPMPVTGRSVGGWRPGLGSTKIADRHLERLAIVYVRQSSPQQVHEHRESRARQYATWKSTCRPTHGRQDRRLKL